MTITAFEKLFSYKLPGDVCSVISEFLGDYKLRDDIPATQLLHTDPRYGVILLAKIEFPIVKSKASLFINSIYKRKRWFDKYYDICIGKDMITSYISNINIYELEYNGDETLISEYEASELMLT